MTSPAIPETVDSTIHDIHQIREKLSDKFDGDIGAILTDARERQKKMGRKILSRGELESAKPHSSDR